MVNLNLPIELPFYNLSNDELISLLMGEPLNKIELHNNDLMDFLIRVRKDENFQKLNFDYYADEHFNTMVRNTSKLIDISVFHLNIRSLNSHSRGLCQYLSFLSFSFDIIILSEIWKNNIDFYQNILPGYTLYYDVPRDTNVGGVGIYVKDKFEVKQKHDYKINSNGNMKVENLWLEVSHSATKYIIGGIYRHPNRSMLEFTDAIDPVLRKNILPEYPMHHRRWY